MAVLNGTLSQSSLQKKSGDRGDNDSAMLCNIFHCNKGMNDFRMRLAKPKRPKRNGGSTKQSTRLLNVRVIQFFLQMYHEYILCAMYHFQC